MPSPMDESLREKVELLDGSRRREAIRKAAVRIEDLQPLFDLANRPRSKKAADTVPTRAEHDALVADVHEIHRILRDLQRALQARVLP